MISILIISVIAFLCLVGVWFEYGLDDFGLGLLMTFVIGLVAAMVMAGVSLLFCINQGTYHKDMTLVSLNVSGQATGQFYLGSGTIDGGPGFSGYVKMEANQYRLVNNPADYSTISYLKAGEQPHVTFACIKPRSNKWWQPFNFTKSSDKICDWRSVTWFIPEGSIKENFNMAVGNGNTTAQESSAAE